MKNARKTLACLAEGMREALTLDSSYNMPKTSNPGQDSEKLQQDIQNVKERFRDGRIEFYKM